MGAKADSVKLYHLTIAPSLLSQLLSDRVSESDSKF